jgi:hypothetical protein
MASRQAFWSPPFNKLWPSSCGLTRTVNCDVSVVLVLWRFIGDITLHIYIYIHIVHIYMYIYICTYIYIRNYSGAKQLTTGGPNLYFNKLPSDSTYKFKGIY